MTQQTESLAVYLEVGKRRTFAGAIDWPGWCRSGREPEEALRRLLEYAPRYARVLSETSLDFEPPKDLEVVESLRGNMDTDMGSPTMPPSADAAPVSEADLRTLNTLLRACWRTFDAAVEVAQSKPLGSGGRDLSAIVEHVIGGDGGYLWRLATRKRGDMSDLPPQHQLERTREMLLKGLEDAAHGQVPTRGPRGGQRWSPRYFVRRVAWHVLDHAWEIEDRL